MEFIQIAIFISLANYQIINQKVSGYGRPKTGMSIATGMMESREHITFHCVMMSLCD